MTWFPTRPPGLDPLIRDALMCAINEAGYPARVLLSHIIYIIIHYPWYIRILTLGLFVKDHVSLMVEGPTTFRLQLDYEYEGLPKLERYATRWPNLMANYMTYDLADPQSLDKLLAVLAVLKETPRGKKIEPIKWDILET